MPSVSRQLVIRADASPSIGGGHVQRCLTLAGSLRDLGWRCALLGVEESRLSVALPDWLEFVASSGTDAGDVGPLRRHWPNGVDLLIVDHYGLAEPWEEQCRGWARRIMAIDDLADRRHDCDLLLDPSAGRSRGEYANLVPARCRLLLGPGFALLRPDFAAWRERALAHRASPGRRFYINFGAADPRGIGGRILAALLAIDTGFDLDLVCGASVEQVPGLRRMAAAFSGNAAIHGRVGNVAELMARADLAIGAGGSASWERCAVGLPSVVVAIADNQETNARTLHAAGAALAVGCPSAMQPDEVARAALALLDDKSALAAMSRKAAALCDGKGTERVRNAIVDLLDS
jgi:UDP-2,4-diacetamido-2,4,6-trideoxy-beta-L-altropyranose hydrolase